MYPCVHSRFREFNQLIEGDIPYMYNDIKGLVTVGVGNLIDSIPQAQALAFRFKQKPAADQKVKGTPGSRATAEQIAAEWRRVKGDLSASGTGFAASHYAAITDLELSASAIGELVETKLLQHESTLKAWREFAGFEQWAADAQLGLLSMSWALGPGRAKYNGLIQFTHFRAACADQDFARAASHCHISVIGNPGVVKRNTANALLFANAALVVAGEKSAGLTRSVLYYPAVLAM